MVIAGHDGAYGSTDSTVPVQSPLMVIPTLPRALGSNEEVTLPVNVFAMDEDLKEATVEVKVEGPVALVPLSTTGAPTIARPTRVEVISRNNGAT